ncbi:hypothetical protein OB13_20005 [Pontibacter sp. HJ8]
MRSNFIPCKHINNIILLKVSFVEITLDQQNGILIVRWLRTVRSQEYRVGIEETRKILLAHKQEKLLVNNQRMGVLTMDDQGWLAEISVEVFSQINLKKLAIISSTNFLQQHTNETLDARVKESTPYFETQYFLSEWEGLEWLKLPE